MFILLVHLRKSNVCPGIPLHFSKYEFKKVDYAQCRLEYICIFFSAQAGSTQSVFLPSKTNEGIYFGQMELILKRPTLVAGIMHETVSLIKNAAKIFRRLLMLLLPKVKLLFGKSFANKADYVNIL